MTSLPLWPFDPPERTTYETPSARSAKLEALGKTARSATPFEQEEASAQLARQLATEPDPWVREQIMRAAARIQTVTAGMVLRAGLDDADVQVRITACRGLGRRQDPATLALLSEVLHKDTDTDVRQAAIEALSKFNQPEAVRSLAIALEDPDPALQYRAVQSLREMTGLDYGNNASAWLQYVRGSSLPSRQPVSVADRVRSLFRF
jgi:HEAT repeat protein